MASHGTARTSQAPRSEEARQKELKQIEAYRKLEDQIRDAAKAEDFSESTLDLTSKLLKGTKECKGNPEYYTVWNHRKRCLLKLFEHDKASVEPRLSQDFDFILPLMKQYPKCYWIWNHRFWLLTQVSKRLSEDRVLHFWQNEFALVQMMHSRDQRNFHGWNYRRKVVKELDGLQGGQHGSQQKPRDENQSPAEAEQSQEKEVKQEDMRQLYEDEFAYTTKMVSGNLSNFSAWHQRSTLIPKILDLREASAADRRTFFDQELDYIRERVLADPEDQSLWFYHQYIIGVLTAPPESSAASNQILSGSRRKWVNFTNHDREEILRKEIEEIKDVLEDTDDCKWIYQSLLSLAQAYLEVEGGNQGSVFTTKELRHWLAMLQKLDPLRSGRWKDYSQRLGLD